MLFLMVHYLEHLLFFGALDCFFFILKCIMIYEAFKQKDKILQNMDAQWE